jgi:hypothetical protein
MHGRCAVNATPTNQIILWPERGQSGHIFDMVGSFRAPEPTRIFIEQ